MKPFLPALLLAAAAALPGAAAAQGTAPTTAVALDLGLLRHGVSDAAASPLRFHGSLRTLGLAFARHGAATRVEVEAAGAAGHLDTGITTDGRPAEDAVMATLEARWLRRVATIAGGRIDLLAGGQVAAHASVREHFYGPGPSGGSEHLADLIAPLEVAGGLDWRPRPGVRLHERLALPLAGVVMRTPYGGLKRIPDARFAAPGEILGLHHSLAVERDLGPRAALRAAWAFSLLRHDEPREVRFAGHRLTAAAVVRWGGAP